MSGWSLAESSFDFHSPVVFVQFQLSSDCFDLVRLLWSGLARFYDIQS